MVSTHDLFHKRGINMQTLAQAKQNFVYQVERIETEEKTKRHLQNIGVVVGSKIVVVNLSGNNAI